MLFAILVAGMSEVIEEKNDPVKKVEPVEDVEDAEEVSGDEDFADLDDDELLAALGEHGLDDDDDDLDGDFDLDDEDDILDDSGEAEDEDFSAMPLDKIRKLHQKLDVDGDGNASLAELLQFSDKVHKETIKIIVPELLGMLDHIKDGKLSLEEILQDMSSDDGSSELTEEELNTWKELETLKFKLADADGDGFLSVEEVEHMFYPETHEGVLRVGIESLIKRRDGDGDGKLNFTEFWGNSTGNETDATENGTDSPKAYTESEHKTFSKLDTNGDNLLDADELVAWESGKFHTEETLRELLDVADTNHDGHLSVEEIEEAKANIQKIDATHDLVQWIKHLEL